MACSQQAKESPKPISFAADKFRKLYQMKVLDHRLGDILRLYDFNLTVNPARVGRCVGENRLLLKELPPSRIDNQIGMCGVLGRRSEQIDHPSREAEQSAKQNDCILAAQKNPSEINNVSCPVPRNWDRFLFKGRLRCARAKHPGFRKVDGAIACL